MGRDGGVYRLWVSASSCAYRRVFLGAGPCDVYRTVFCPTLSSLSVRTYSARVSASPPNGRACSFVRAGAVRMCAVLVQGLGMGCVLPTGQGVRPELILELVCYISRVYVSYGDRLG